MVKWVRRYAWQPIPRYQELTMRIPTPDQATPPATEGKPAARAEVELHEITDTSGAPKK